MPRLLRHCQIICELACCTILIFCDTAHAEQPDETEGLSIINKVTDTIENVTNNGRWDIYLSGYAHHSRTTYTDTRLHQLNEHAWGGGFGKTVRNADGNDESLLITAIRDSNLNWQYSAGYNYQWIYHLLPSLEAGIGLTAQMISRSDWFGRVPFPAILPVFSFGSPNAKLVGTYVPRISTKKGKGDVTLIMLKITF